jgi:excisionase family DNA binding protein
VKKDHVVEPSTYSVAQAAAVLGIAPKTLYDAISAGTSDIKHIRIGARILIPKAAVDAALSQSSAA